MRTLSTVCYLFILSSLLSGCTVTTEGNMAECEMEAMKQFGSLRKPHPISGVLWPSSLEYEYRISCMKARGFVLDYEKAEKDHSIDGIGSDAIWKWMSRYWKRDSSRLTSSSKP